MTYGSSAVLTTTGSVANALGTFSDVYGRVTTTTSTTPAVLNRPLTINTILRVLQDTNSDGVFVRNTASMNGINLQALNANNSSALHFNGFYDGTNNRSYNSKRRWGLYNDNGGANDRLRVEHALDGSPSTTVQTWEATGTTIATPLTVNNIARVVSNVNSDGLYILNSTSTVGMSHQVLGAFGSSCIFFNGWLDGSTNRSYTTSKRRWGICNDTGGVNDRLKIECAPNAGPATTIQTWEPTLSTFDVDVLVNNTVTATGGYTSNRLSATH